VSSAIAAPGANDAGSAQQLERSQILALVFRAGTSVVIWIFCFAALMAGTVRTVNFEGVSIACVFVLMTCLPSFFIMRRVPRGRPAFIIAGFDRLLVIAGYTGVIYSLGGIEAAYLLPLYALFTMYVGIASPWRTPYTTAIESIVCFSFIVISEHLGLLPSFTVDEAFRLKWDYELAILGVTAGFLLVSAFISASAARLIDESRERLREQNAELERARDRAQESDRMKSEFLANMSHELRTPLNHVIGFTELVLEDEVKRLDQAHRESLTEVYSSAQHLLSLINDVLDMAKVEAGRVELERKDVDLTALLQHSLAAGKQSAARRGVLVSAEIGDIPKQGWVDERRLLQILLNLLENAVKFTEPGGSVLLRAGECTPGILEITVSDSGVGIQHEDLERIFLPFERAKGMVGARFPGTGLGLSLVRRLVELHGGRIWAESAGEGKGATFRFTLPVTPPGSVVHSQ
jgi:signal transduction histidine kinase